MKQSIFPFLLLVAVLSAAACKSGSASRKGKSAVGSDFALEIRHTPCRGFCPAYVITVDAAGHVVYEGTRNVERVGKFEKTIEVKTVAALAAAVEEAGFWALDKEYGGGVADLPSVVTKVTHHGKTHAVNNIRNAPEQLKALEAKIESLIGDEGYTEVKP